MMSSVFSCDTWRLYVIVDNAAAGERDLAWIAKQAIRGGADAIQLRDKAATTKQLLEEARRIHAVTHALNIPLIVNDRADVALAAGADGVHLGQDDLPIAEARAMLGPHRLIGLSTHTREQALQADQQAIDYLALGPVYPTPTKPAYGPIGLALIADVVSHVRHPLVVIGGIDQTTLADVAASGARCVAVVRAVCQAEDPDAAARALKGGLVGRQQPRKVGTGNSSI